MLERRIDTLRLYGVGLSAFLAAFMLRAILNPWFPPGFPFLTFFPAVVFSAVLAGRGAAILCAALSLAAAWFYFIPPYNSFSLGLPTVIALIFYVFVVAVDIFFIDGMKRALDKLEVERSRSAALAASRDLLAQELQHRVSNNLQVVGALLRLQGDAVSDPQARRALTEASLRVDLVATIQRRLHALEGDAPPFRVIAEQLLADAAQAAGADVTVSIHGGEAPLAADQATPVTLVMLECFNNALEHGFAGRSGAVGVTLDQTGAEHRLTVADDGAGPPADFDPAKSRSLGLRIVRAMAAQLQGRFQILREDGRTVATLSYRPAAG